MLTEPGAGKAFGALVPDLRAVRERPLFPVAVYLCLGVASVTVLPASAKAGFLILLALFLFSSILFALKKDISFFIILMSFAAGYALACAALPAWAADPWAPQGEQQVSGRIASVSTTSGGYASVVVQDVRVGGQPLAGCVLLTARSGSDKASDGDGIAFSAQLERPQPSRFYGDFNARGYYLRQGIRFTAFAAELKITPARKNATILALPGRARRYATDLLNTYLSPQSAGFVNALLSGDTSGISTDMKDAFVMLGVAHLLAVSGLNISLTAGAAWLLCRKLRLPMPVSWGVSFVVMAAYVLFAGLTASVLRAAVMWLVMMCALLAARRYDPLSSISAAVILILAVNPLDLFDAGFQLSFAATAAMFLWLAPLTRHVPEKKWMKRFAGAVGVTLCVTFFALPIILTYFNGVSPISPLANLVLVPASFVLQLAGTALLFVGFLPGVAALLGPVLDKAAAFYLQNVSALTWTAAVLPAATPALGLSFAYLLLGLLVSPSVASWRPGGRAAVFSALAVAAAVMLSPLSPALTWHSDAAVLDEGKSTLSVWWTESGKNYAACGEDLSALSGYLKSRGISRLDGLYVLLPKPPKDGSELLGMKRIAVGSLYVPKGWLGDPAASDFLTQAVLLGMQPEAAEGGPVDYYVSPGGAAVLQIETASGSITYLPWASSGWDDPAKSRIAGADAALLNVSAAKSAKTLAGLSPERLILPGDVALAGAETYNIIKLGSIESSKGASGMKLTPWMGGWADGLQGNFR